MVAVLVNKKKQSKCNTNTVQWGSVELFTDSLADAPHAGEQKALCPTSVGCEIINGKTAEE